MGSCVLTTPQRTNTSLSYRRPGNISTARNEGGGEQDMLHLPYNASFFYKSTEASGLSRVTRVVPCISFSWQ